MRAGGGGCRKILAIEIRTLLKTLDAQHATISQFAPKWTVTGTSLFLRPLILPSERVMVYGYLLIPGDYLVCHRTFWVCLV